MRSKECWVRAEDLKAKGLDGMRYPWDGMIFQILETLESVVKISSKIVLRGWLNVTFFLGNEGWLKVICFFASIS